MSFGQDSSHQVRVGSDILPNQEESRLDISLFQHFQKARRVFRAGPVVKSHRDVRLINIYLRIGSGLGFRFVGRRARFRLLRSSDQLAEQNEYKDQRKSHKLTKNVSESLPAFGRW